jgi:hypothetical protein
MRLLTRVLAAAAALVAIVPAAPARAAAPTHVAIVVTYKGTTVARCAPVKSSGLADLQSRFTVVVGQPPSPYAGFVFTIDGHGTTHPDNTHYWAYYHRVNGTWVYSSVGAASYQPPAGAVEGWAYDNGSQTAPTPPARSYSSVCGTTATAPTPAAPSNPSARAVPVATSHATNRSPASPKTGPSRPATPRTVPAAGTTRAAAVPPARAPAVRHSPSAARRSPQLSAAPGSPAAALATTVQTTASARPSNAGTSPAAAPRRGSGAPWAPLTALVVVAVLGGGAWWRLSGKGRA